MSDSKRIASYHLSVWFSEDGTFAFYLDPNDDKPGATMLSGVEAEKVSYAMDHIAEFATMDIAKRMIKAAIE